MFLTLIPATIVAALASEAQDATALGNIDLAIWLCIAPAQAAGARCGARAASRIDGANPEPRAGPDPVLHGGDNAEFRFGVTSRSTRPIAGVQ
jgi:hypothetical protein